VTFPHGICLLAVRGVKIAKKKANHYFKLCGIANGKDFQWNYRDDMVHRWRNLCGLAADIDHLKREQFVW
jgi:hypothetical protein